jgi:hypothetical protein
MGSLTKKVSCQQMFEQLRQAGYSTARVAFTKYTKYVATNEAETMYNGLIQKNQCSGALVSYRVLNQKAVTVNGIKQTELEITCQDGNVYQVLVNDYK